jgi:lysophospholipid acyltransferase (LPLAT)-like uncharacterized protein
LHGRDLLGSYLHGGPAIFAFWHERLPLMPALWTLAQRERRGRDGGRMHVLVSRHQDGRLIGEIMRGFGVDIVYGSSARGREQRGGAASLRGLAAALGRGGQVVVTPDGPRGPARQAAPGVAQLAAMAAVPIVPCAAQTNRRRVLPSWDRMVLPLPFGRGVLVCGAPILLRRDGWAAELPGIEQALTEAAERADALCGI